MGKKKPQFKCYEKTCERVFTTLRGRASHQRMHPYVPPAPLPEPSEHVNYIDIVKGSYSNWGQSMTEYQRKHPSLDTLKVGALMLIVKYLLEILAELKKPRQII